MIRTFRDPDDGDGTGLGIDVDDVVDAEDREETGDDSARILCGACRHELTTGEATTTVDGAHRHVKVNPHGHVFHIRCFEPVAGVVAIGEPSDEFSWFTGYRWQIAICGDCQAHVGWWFSGDGEFGALIEGRIIEEE